MKRKELFGFTPHSEDVAITVEDDADTAFVTVELWVGITDDSDWHLRESITCADRADARKEVNRLAAVYPSARVLWP